MRLTFYYNLFFVCLILLATNSFARVVNVGGYHFPPFVEVKNNKYYGLTIDLISELNHFQKKYQFQFIPTSSKRRYRDFNALDFDIMIFENIKWGWDDRPVQSSKVFLKGGELYITKKEDLKNQTYFNNFKGKRILGYIGYHYAFANYNADEMYLKKNFNAIMTLSHEGNIRSVLANRADIAVITISFLQKHLKLYPEIRDKILISKTLDQTYHHTILVRKNISPDITEINALLDQMEKKGVLNNLFIKYGIKK